MKKKLVLSCVLLSFAVIGFGQLDTPKRNMSDRELGLYYLTKHKQQKTLGWIFLLGGSALATVGWNTLYTNLWSEDNDTASTLLLYGGQMAAIASFPLFMSAAKNKGRAEILLRYENMPRSLKTPGKPAMASLGVAVPLGSR